MNFLQKLKMVLTNKLEGKSIRKLLVTGYLISLTFGLLLTGIYVLFPKLVVCSELFGQRVCTPAGIFIALLLSLPGYLIVGNILSFFPAIAWEISLIFVIGVSVAIYYLIGFFIDMVREKKLSVTQLFVYIIFAVLLILVLSLLKLFR